MPSSIQDQDHNHKQQTEPDVENKQTNLSPSSTTSEHTTVNDDRDLQQTTATLTDTNQQTDRNDLTKEQILEKRMQELLARRKDRDPYLVIFDVSALIFSPNSSRSCFNRWRGEEISGERGGGVKANCLMNLKH